MHKQYYEVQEEVQNKRLQQSIAIGEAQLKIQTHKLEAVHAEREQQRLLEDNERQTSELLDYAKQFVWLQDVLQEFEQEFKNELTSQTIEIETLKTLLRSFQVLRRKVQLHDSDEIIRRAPQHFLPALHEQAKSELTELEQHVAVLIRAGLTGKQMPSLIHRSDGYLRHVRTKLKEKLPLPPNTTLKKYLQSL
jgi:signal recognition particle GTPase